VGATNAGYERVHGGFGYCGRNQEGEDVLNFALAYDLLIANTLEAGIPLGDLSEWSTLEPD
jgi:hypothetical protein